ncbi:hypothetical protein OS493_022898 [Desmophyllum pertusum]|uniref:Uncharacterized protein n=1 Tax=Desmophyllum pertusum TaxID=174260 RepID=A0A9X0D2K5_9CNID|nr:hypothetical protein OS493_022898 [Desmophyllum pertusum]
MTTPYTKRIKQERDWEPSFSENKEGISSSITSLQSIVNEVVRSFENDNNYENILSSQRTDNSGFNSTNDTPLSVQKDAIVIERKERQLNSSPQFAADANEVKTGGHENIEASARFVDSHKEKRTVLGSFADQVQAQTTRPILRTLKSLQSGTSEGFAFDHNFFPKLVGVHSISSPTSNSSTEVESHLDFQQINRSSPASAPLEKLGQDQNISDSMEEAVDVYEIDATASSPTNRITRKLSCYSLSY